MASPPTGPGRRAWSTRPTCPASTTIGVFDMPCLKSRTVTLAGPGGGPLAAGSRRRTRRPLRRTPGSTSCSPSVPDRCIRPAYRTRPASGRAAGGCSRVPGLVQLKLLVQGVLSQVRQEVHPPTQERLAVRPVGVGRVIVLVRFVGDHGQPDFLHVVAAGQPVGRVAHLVDRPLEREVQEYAATPAKQKQDAEDNAEDEADVLFLRGGGRSRSTSSWRQAGTSGGRCVVVLVAGPAAGAVVARSRCRGP